VTEILSFAALGLGAGGLYALLALGIVLVYRGSGVVNFAHGAIGAFGAYVFWELRGGLPTALAILIGIVFSGALGAAIELVVMRPLRNASGMTRLIATLAVLVIVQSGIALYWGPAQRVVKPFLPHSTLRIGPLQIGADRLVILAITVVLSAVLAVYYRRSRFGLATSAAAENQRGAAALGISPWHVSLVNWSVGAMLAALAGILLSPFTSLQVSLCTVLIIPALAAALVGEMRSFPITVLAGLAIGVAQSEITRYVSTPGWSTAVPFVVIALVMIVRGRSLPVKGGSYQRPARLGDGRMRPLPMIVTLAAVVLSLELWFSPIWVSAFITTISAAILVLSLVVLTGYAGQISLVQFVMGELGALLTARLALSAHIPFVPSVLLGALGCAALGAVVGLPAVRTRGVNLAVITLGLGVAINALIFSSATLAGDQYGYTIESMNLFGWDFDPLLHGNRYAIVALAVFVLIALMVTNIRRNALGRRLIAVRGNERAAAALGIGVRWAKLYAFAVATLISSIGVSLLVFQESPVVFNNGQIDPFQSVTVTIDAVLGGIGYVLGPVVGATLQPGSVSDRFFTGIFGTNLTFWFALVGGILVLYTLRDAPDGVVPRVTMQVRAATARLRDRPRPAGTRASGKPAARPLVRPVARRRAAAMGPGRAPAVTLESVTVRFGGLTAVDKASFLVRYGEIHGLIGPNGAGKTTIIDAIMGLVPIAGGSIAVGEQRIDQWPAHRRVRAGVQRTFQGNELFEELTVEENLRVASDHWRPARYASDLLWKARDELSESAELAVEVFGLRADLRQLPQALPYGRRRLVAIARAVAADPRILLFDEPGAGLTAAEKRELATLLRDLAHAGGRTILLVEHDVELIMSTCDQVTALHMGAVLASGPPDAVRSDEAVIQSYLGRRERRPAGR
jgi:ABC-type branched-subunit amino acid transport system ATPase component/branched-subunit amino acid ABC-type transport system permease component